MTHSHHLCSIVHVQFTGDEKRWRYHRNRCDMHCIVTLKSWYKHHWWLFNMVGRHLWPVPPTQHLCVCVEMWPCVFRSTWCFIVLQGAVFPTGEVKYSSDPVNTLKLPNPTVKRLFKLARDAVDKSIYCSERLSICNDFRVKCMLEALQYWMSLWPLRVWWNWIMIAWCFWVYPETYEHASGA